MSWKPRSWVVTVRSVAWLAVALTAIGIASGARAECDAESSCSFKKPNILLVLDYSSSMTGFENSPAFFPPGQTQTTRWDAALDAAGWILGYRKGFFADNARVGLTRFAHDPDLAHAASQISTDRSFPPIVDGFAIDLPFDDSKGKYLECKSTGVEAAIQVLHGTPPPPVVQTLDPNAMMLTWTRGALRSARQLVENTRKNHKAEPGEGARDYEVVLMTDGDWTCADRVGQACDEDPAKEAALLRAANIPVHVIALGDATMQPSLNEVALQGGTVKAIDATSPEGIVDAFNQVLDGIRDSVIVPTCTSKLARIMVVMDASTSMLMGDAPGKTKWDKARFALSGNPAAPNPGDPGYVEPALAHKLDIGGRQVAIEDVVHVGLVAFGAADEQQVLAGFGPCMRDNIAWAMDPKTSCDAPGCTDPYGGAPLRWTFKDSDKDRKPAFVRRTRSYMPICHQTSGSTSCAGDTPTTFTGQGLEFARKVVNDYKKSSAPFKSDDHTRYVNVLLTDGQTSEGSSDVQAVLRQLSSEGVDTFVIGFGAGDEIDRAQLDQYAVWGNTQHAIVVDPTQPTGAAELADALAGVVKSLGIDACCVLNACASEPEPVDPHAVCGDGQVDGDEVCDDGKANATYGHCGGDCRAPHVHCGDMRIDEPQETCDDGNTSSRDGCDARCQTEDDFDAGVTGPPSGAGGGPPKVTTEVVTAPPTAVTQPLTTAPNAVPIAGARAGAGGGAGGKADSSDSCGCRLQPSRGVSAGGVAWFGLGALLVGRMARRRRRVRYARGKVG